MTSTHSLESVPLPRLSEILNQHRGEGKQIVFTNGVFDLIHPGHVRYLRTARSHGDILVVALNSDVSTRRLKGPTRPIIPEKERIKILASLEMVDYVTTFDEDTPLQAIEVLRPDVLIKGGDYELSEIVGRTEVESWGGTVLTVPFIEGNSSSNVVERIIRSAQKTQ